MNRPAFRRIVHHAARWSLALVFVVAAVTKLTDMPRFAAHVGDFGLVYDTLVVPTAWGILSAELLVAVAMACKLRGGLLATGILLLGFTGVLAYGVWLGLDIDCGCFGPSVTVSLRTQLVVDVGLLLVCGIIYWSDKPC